ncbi:hypothetical protein SAMN05421687_102354 [Salimicrobium flavidum]|uniref:Uncharacterized protein n=1 Tax=Salimicrobium flavidum TaxID=570947 RepID=A0A1N7IWB8_9BACI|nr:hypothetical protein SAMN05421687_102354 [Salimicrobium flavidum]
MYMDVSDAQAGVSGLGVAFLFGFRTLQVGFEVFELGIWRERLISFCIAVLTGWRTA